MYYFILFTDIVVVPVNGVEEGVDNNGFEDPIIVSPVSSEKIPEVQEKGK